MSYPVRPPLSAGAGVVRGGPRRPGSFADRRARRHPRWRAALALAFAALALAACQGAGPAPTDAWTEVQLAGVLDLSELGRALTIAPTGDHLLLDGRVLPADVLERFPYLTMGRSSNLLRFADDALAAMSPEAQAFVLRAAPGELRAGLAGYGLEMADLRAAWADRGEVDLAGLRAVAARLDGAGLRSAAGRAGAGTRLLADLGVAP